MIELIFQQCGSRCLSAALPTIGVLEQALLVTGKLTMRRATNASLTAKFIGVVVTALVVGTAVSLAVVLLMMAVAPSAAR